MNYDINYTIVLRIYFTHGKLMKEMYDAYLTDSTYTCYIGEV